MDLLGGAGNLNLGSKQSCKHSFMKSLRNLKLISEDEFTTALLKMAKRALDFLNMSNQERENYEDDS